MSEFLEEYSGYIIIAVIYCFFAYGPFSHKEAEAPRAQYQAPTYQNSYYGSSEDSEDYEEPENPYYEGSGHSAGYEWAEETGGDCSSHSNSFNEGCEEYYDQLDAHEEEEEYEE